MLLRSLDGKVGRTNFIGRLLSQKTVMRGPQEPKREEAVLSAVMPRGSAGPQPAFPQFSSLLCELNIRPHPGQAGPCFDPMSAG